MICLLCGNESHVLPSWRRLFCNDIEEAACKNCKGRFEKTEPGCRICGVPGDEECPDCRQWETTRFAGLIHSGRSLYMYNEAMKSFLHQYKFLQDAALSKVFAADLNNALNKEKAIIVPIPMKPENLKERTFAQVDLMLEAAELPYLHLLRKTGGVQGEKNKAERMAAEELFAWNGSAVPKQIVLVDDLYTTGTTMRHAAMVLKEAGAEEIRLFSVIRA